MKTISRTDSSGSSLTSHSTEATPIEKLMESIGVFIQFWGFKKIHGRVWTLVFLSPEPVDAKFLIRSLNVSKASISLVLKDLLKYEVILSVKKTSPSTQKYIANPNILSGIRNVMSDRERKLIAEIGGAQQSLCQLSETEKINLHVDSERLAQLGQMVYASQVVLDQIINSKPMELSMLFGSLDGDLSSKKELATEN